MLMTLACRVGYWGDGCQNQCLCKSGGICDHVTGNCSCPAGLTGALCELREISACILLCVLT